MLALGLRGYRVYLSLGAATAGYLGGAALGLLMHVPALYVGLPAAAIAAFLVWPRAVAKPLISVVVGFAAGCTCGTLLTYGLELTNFWVAFGLAGAAVTGLAFVARRFLSALFFGALGAFGAVAALGGVVRADSGFFSPGGYVGAPVILAVVVAALVLGSMVAQPLLAPERDL
jgi:hypothetical protein